MNDKDYRAELPEETATADDFMPRILDDEQIASLVCRVSDDTVIEPEKAPGVCVRPLPCSPSLNVADNGETEAVPPKTLHKHHREKMRQRFIEEGLEGFQKHNILEFLLFYAIPYKDTNELAHRLLNHYHGNLCEVLGADVESLKKIDGVGENTAVFLSMLPQVFRVYREELLTLHGISGRKQVEEYIANRFTGERVERVLIACMDNRWNLIGDEFVSSGSVNFSSVDRRGIIETCLRYNATTAIIAHNHPRGTALPSRDDLNTTIEVRRALEVIGVRLVDHLIVAREDYVSLACSKNYNSLF